MKFLKYLLILILLLVIVFFAKGFLTPSIQYDSTVTVNKSAKEAWAVMSDEANLPKWIEGFKRSELTSGHANTVGAKSNIYVDQGGQEMVMEETVTAIKENEHLGMTFTMDMMNMDYDMHFEEKDGKTTITSKSKTTGNGLVNKSMVSFMSGMMKSQEDKNLKSLKKLIDGNTKDYFSSPAIGVTRG